MKPPQIVFIHGGEAFDDFCEGWFSTITNTARKLSPYKEISAKWPDTLESQLAPFSVLKLKMPAKYNAKYSAWKRHFEKSAARFEDPVILVGWSLGANFLAKYFAENKTDFTVAQLHLVAGCYGLGGGFDLASNFPGFLTELPVHLYHSTDDFVVDFKDFEQYCHALPQANAHTFSDRNHFLQPEFPELIRKIKSEKL